MEHDRATEDARLIRETVSRLQIKSQQPATRDELQRIEARAGLRLCALYSAFALMVGKCIANCVVGNGADAGKRVMFFGAGETLSRLEELEGQGLVPFADDLFGDVYYLVNALGVADPVRRFDDATAEFVDVSPSFREFLLTLKPA